MYAIEPDPADRWMTRGLCVLEDPKLWDGLPDGRSESAPRNYNPAKAICAECPVNAKCLERAIETEDTGCMRAGKTPGELTKLVKAKQPAPQRRAQIVKRTRVAA